MCRGISTAVILFLGLLACSCGESVPTHSQDEGSGHYFRRFVPFEDRWRRAWELPKKPQLKPKVVLWEVSEYDPETQATDEQHKAAADLPRLPVAVVAMHSQR